MFRQEEIAKIQWRKSPVLVKLIKPHILSFMFLTFLYVSCSKDNSSTSSDSSDTSGTNYSQSGGTITKSSQSYTSSVNDISGVLVKNSGTYNLSASAIITSGNTTSDDSSSFYGLNAGVLATSGSTITLTGCKISTTGTGANGVFSTGTGTTVNLINDTITCTNDGAHGVDATLEGVLNLTNVIINTAGAHGAAISTDRGGGTVNVTGGVATATGTDSPGIYSTGTITVTNGIIVGAGSEAAVIEGANTITLTNTTLTGSKGSRDRGVFIYQSMSGDATGTDGTFTMTGGTYNWTSTGPAFYNTNSTAIINLKGVNIITSSTILLKASSDQWGTTGSNGGNIVFTADGQSLSGDLIADSYSTIKITLQNNSSLNGAINADNTASSTSLILDESSTWNVSGDSYISTFSDTNGISGTNISNIYGNGHTVYYNNIINTNLGGKTYSLNGGGYLAPNTNTIN